MNQITIEKLLFAGCHEDCLKECQNLLKTDPENCFAWKYAGKSLLALGQLENAKQCLLKANQLDNYDPEIAKDIGNIYLNLRNKDATYEWYNKALKINAKYAPAINNLASLSAQDGNDKEAINLYKNAIKSNPTLTQAYIGAAACCLKLADCEQAELFANQALAIDEASPGANEMLGIIFQKKTNTEQAIKYYQNELKVNPQANNSLLNLGQLFLQKGNVIGAIKSLEKASDIAPSQECSLLLAQAYQNNGQLKEAITEYKKVSFHQSNNKLVPFNLGLCLLNNGQNNAAIEAFQKAIRLDENFTPAWGYIGNALKNEGHYEEALKATQKVLEIEPENSIAHMNMGSIYKDFGKYNEAISFTLRSLKLNPENPDTLMNLGSIYKEAGNFNQALSYTLQSLKLRPDNPVAHINLGSIYKELRDLDQALSCTLKSLELDPDNPNAYMSLGIIYKELGNLDQALASTLKSLKLKPDQPNTLVNLGIIYKEFNKPEQALSSLLKSLELKPDNPDAHMILGILYEELGNLDQALDSTLQSIKLKPDNPKTHKHLGGIYKNLGNLDQALASTLKSLEIKPDDTDTLINLSCIHHALGNFDLALSFILKSLKIRSDEPTALINLGTIYYELGNYEKALSTTIKSLELKSDNPNAFINLSLIHKGLGNLDQALTYTLRSLEIEPSSSRAFYSLGRIRMAQGDLKEAKKALVNAIKSDPLEAAAYYELSIMISTTKEAEELLQMTKSIAMDKLTPMSKAYAQFTLSNCFHAIKDYDSASKHLQMANQCKLSVYPSNANQLRQLIEKHLPQSTYLNKAQINAQCGKSRIFIVGMPRSGSTLLEGILSINPEIQDLGEVKSLEHAIHSVQKHPENDSNNPSLDDLYSQQQPFNNHRIKYTVDKQLYNFMYVGWINHCMPSSKIIHCRRNPMDNILSMYRSNLTAGNNYTASLKDSAKLLIAQEQAMQIQKNRCTENIFTFNYDQFVNAPKENLSKLLEWLDLEFNENYLHPEKRKTNVNTASVMQARKPINNKSVGGWKNYEKLLRPAKRILEESGIQIE
ncbi:sulfotransferase family protein [Synechococcus sp. UW179A]|uniref:sulfotransferase family protein n=1 Tax=Synechococcus sp. UW179A TaxID=2575510 RepID=UPI000E0F4BC0|nr:sulfotransferase family protein [Synechococcus sp. UW179A]